MRPSSFAYLLNASFRGRRLRLFGIVCGLGIGMLALGLSVMAGLGAGRSLSRYLERLYPSQRVVLLPRTLDAFWVRMETSQITPETVEKVRALPGVVRLSPEATIRFPVSAEGALFGNVYRTDVTVTGVEQWLLGDEVSSASFAHNPQAIGKRPAVLSAYFLDLYNMALAESNSLPKLSTAAIIGRDFQLLLGASSLHPADDRAKVRIEEYEIVGLTTNPELLGLVLPLEAIEAFNEWYGLPGKNYRALHVELDSAEAVEGLKTHLPALGLTMKDPMAAWRRAIVGAQLVAAGFLLLGVLVFVLSLAYMASAVTVMLAQRRSDLRLFHALGATPRQLLSLMGSEIALVSAVGIAAGLLLASAILRGAESFYQQWREGRDYLPESVFALPLPWIVLLGAVCWGISVGLGILKMRLVFREAPGNPRTR